MNRPIYAYHERGQVRSVAERWKAQYWSPKGGWYWACTDTERVYNALVALNAETATAADVSAIIGNESWVRAPECDQCGERTYDGCMLGEEPDYESATANICHSCLKQALAMLEGV